eukprot:COSAG01_NODE_38624_length_487_cov_0.884021_2_plen_76_part_01
MVLTIAFQVRPSSYLGRHIVFVVVVEFKRHLLLLPSLPSSWLPWLPWPRVSDDQPGICINVLCGAHVNAGAAQQHE